MADTHKPKLVKKTGERIDVAPPPVKHVPTPIPVMPKTSVRDSFSSGGAGSDLIFTVSGLDQMAQTLRDMPRYARQAAGIEMSNILWDIIDDAKENYVPEETGALRDSGMADNYMDLYSYDADFIQLSCWFGAPMSYSAREELAMISQQMGKPKVRNPEYYALQQHEFLYDNYTKPGTGPKYLEKPFMAAEPTIAPRIAAAVGMALGSDVLGLGMDPGTYMGTFGGGLGI